MFAPGYGEFSTERGGDVEAVALAIPTDARPGPASPELEALLAGAATIFESAPSGDWTAVSATLDTMRTTWTALRERGAMPRLLDVQMTRALAALAGDALFPAVTDRNVAGARQRALDAGQAVLDLTLRHRSVGEVDLDRFELWAGQVLIDAASEDPGVAVIGDVASLARIRDRIAHTLQASEAQRLDTLLRGLRSAAEGGEFDAATAAADELRALVRRLQS